MANDTRKNSSAEPSIQVRPALHARLYWLCMSVGAIALVVALLLFGWSIWIAILIALLLACPAVVAWVLIAQRYPKVTISRNGK
jgi:Flp pilus assembly protein TadB